jgi:peptidoglycan-associated lipoprotein
MQLSLLIEEECMKYSRLFLLINFIIISGTFAGCCRSTGDVWEDTKSAGRHMGRGMRSLGGKQGDSRQVLCRDDFMGCDDFPVPQSYAQEPEYFPLQDQSVYEDIPMAEYTLPPPRETPGDPGSSVPGISAFRDPQTIPGMSSIFRNVHFDYNSSMVKGEENMQIIRDVGNYMRNHPYTYVFVEGHCDERGPEAFNLALGSRRSNTVRELLAREGANPDNIFTISYGRERPLVMEHHEEAWARNRRAEFKIYMR